jgi:hypothetical protein
VPGEIRYGPEYEQIELPPPKTIGAIAFGLEIIHNPRTRRGDGRRMSTNLGMLARLYLQ